MTTSLATKAFRLAATRPAHLYSNARGYFLFLMTRALGKLSFRPSAGIRLGRNVRIQRLSCLSAERPSASIDIGDHSVVYENARIEAYGNGGISLGERAVVGDVRIYSRASVKIGKRAVFSWNVFIQDFQPHPVEPELRAKHLIAMTDGFHPSFDGHRPPSGPPLDWTFPTDPVIVGDDVWFGANCTVLPGAKIGSGSIVAAGAVVTRGEYPARSILAGNPARVVKTT